MSLSIGIVGLPNVGKSTLFNALVKDYRAEVAAHPFTTIEPNVGIVSVPDDRLQLIAFRLQLAKKIPATIKFIDIAGLVRGAHKGEGLGNQFLSHIRECDAILHLVRFFGENIDPQSDIETIKTELELKDLETIQKAIADKKIEAERPHSVETSRGKKNILNKILKNPEIKLTNEELETISDLNLLSQKPVLLVANVPEEQLNKPLSDYGHPIIAVCAKLESELIDLPEKEQQEYRQSTGENESGLEKIIKTSYKLLNLITFYTLLTNQVQAWPIKKGATSIDAAAKIHTDFAKKFIVAEVMDHQELIKFSSLKEAKEKGKIRAEGKNYLVRDGDVIHFKHR